MAPRRPMNSDYTRQVAEQGLAAVNARRQGSMYDPTNYGAALTHLMNTGYGPSASNGLYSQWMQSRGFQPAGYQVSVGQGNGKYGGFDTLSLLQAAVRGQSELMRQSDRQQADQLSSLASKYLDQAEGMYGQQRDATVQSGALPLDMGVYRASGQQQGDAARAAIDSAWSASDQGAASNKWLGDTTDPYLSALELASQIKQTPLRNYASVAGANYGVDPNIVAGWYPQSSDITDFRQQRDLQSMQNYGMTQNEYEQWLAGQNRDQQNASSDAVDQQDQQYLDYVYNVTGLDGRQLANNLDVTVPQLVSLIDSPEFQQGYNEALAALQSNDGGDAASREQALANVFEKYAGEPDIYGALNYLFSQYAA